MGKNLRCCLACVLPCGALDLIRIVHLNGNIEEFTGPITAGEILEDNPNHVLSKPFSQGVVRQIMILSPESELKRGTIYFLIPSSSFPKKNKSSAANKKRASDKIVTKKCDREVVSEKKSSRCRQHHRVWRPRLESILED